MKRIHVAIDSNLTPKLAGALSSLYGDKGFQFTHISEFSKPRAKDEIWADAFKRFGGRVVISGDCKIAYRPHEAVAFIDNGFISFFPPKCFGEFRAHEKSAIILHQFHQLMNFIDQSLKDGEGSCWRFTCEGKKGAIQLKDCEPEKLAIPSIVLNRTERRKKSI